MPGAGLKILQTLSCLILSTSHKGETTNYPHVTEKELSWMAGWPFEVTLRFRESAEQGPMSV